MPFPVFLHLLSGSESDDIPGDVPAGIAPLPMLRFAYPSLNSLDAGILMFVFSSLHGCIWVADYAAYRAPESHLATAIQLN